jgi:N-formylglutamate deformylase
VDNVFDFKQGTSPLLISVPHAGLELTAAVQAGLVPQALGLPDTDWHIPRLYDFAEQIGASVLSARYSRYVIDLNRPGDDKPLYAGATTGLFPSILFEGDPLFKEGQAPSDAERAVYLQKIWGPYHRALAQELERLRGEFGYALLWDAHSIRAQVPHLFEGQLPDFNLGTFNGASCDPSLAAELESVCASNPDFTYVFDGRFKGGHITRHYGDPARDIHAVQLELVQRAYMEEFAPFRYREEIAAPTRVQIQALLQTMLDWGARRYA